MDLFIRSDADISGQPQSRQETNAWIFKDNYQSISLVPEAGSSRTGKASLPTYI